MERLVLIKSVEPDGPAVRASRDSVFLQAHIRATDGTESAEFKVRNISETGMMAEGPIAFDPGRTLMVELRNIGVVRGQVIWTAGRRFGLLFETPIDPKAARVHIGARPA